MKHKASDDDVRAFIEAVFPEMPDLAIVSFDERHVLQTATQIINDLRQRVSFLLDTRPWRDEADNLRMLLRRVRLFIVQHDYPKRDLVVKQIDQALGDVYQEDVYTRERNSVITTPEEAVAWLRELANNARTVPNEELMLRCNEVVVLISHEIHKKDSV